MGYKLGNTFQLGEEIISFVPVRDYLWASPSLTAKITMFKLTAALC
jgi:hypothetical protein